jgi:hypothetical protein
MPPEAGWRTTQAVVRERAARASDMWDEGVGCHVLAILASTEKVRVARQAVSRLLPSGRTISAGQGLDGAVSLPFVSRVQ